MLWGADAQIQMTIEECAELIVVLAKYGRIHNGSTLEQIAEEIADVQIMINQLKIIFPGVGKAMKAKLERLDKRLKTCHI